MSCGCGYWYVRQPHGDKAILGFVQPQITVLYSAISSLRYFLLQIVRSGKLLKRSLFILNVDCIVDVFVCMFGLVVVSVGFFPEVFVLLRFFLWVFSLGGAGPSPP